MLGRTLRGGFAGGCFAVLMDLDHVIPEYSRTTHIPVAIILFLLTVIMYKPSITGLARVRLEAHTEYYTCQHHDHQAGYSDADYDLIIPRVLEHEE
jgi:hypothetical protein